VFTRRRSKEREGAYCNLHAGPKETFQWEWQHAKSPRWREGVLGGQWRYGVKSIEAADVIYVNAI